MASNIPVIVQGNSFSLAIPLQIYYINGDQMDLQDYTPDPTDEVSVQLKGSRRNYTYTPTIDGNVANIDLSGNELADNYSVVVSIVKANGQRLRSFRTDQFFIVESSDDLTPADIIQGLEENVIYLNSSIFVAGEDGRGITSIVKTSTAGLVDTYTITYTDNTTSTFDVTNGAAGEAGATIASVEKTATVGKVDTYTITMTDGETFNFEVTNGLDGVDLGLANIVNDLTTGGATNVLSAEQGKVLNEKISHPTAVDLSTIVAVKTWDDYDKWIPLSNNYRSKFIPIPSNVKSITLVGSNNATVYALLTTDTYVANSSVSYATGSGKTSLGANATARITSIPSNAKYLWVGTYYSVDRTPSVTFSYEVWDETAELKQDCDTEIDITDKFGVVRVSSTNSRYYDVGSTGNIIRIFKPVIAGEKLQITCNYSTGIGAALFQTIDKALAYADADKIEAYLYGEYATGTHTITTNYEGILCIFTNKSSGTISDADLVSIMSQIQIKSIIDPNDLYYLSDNSPKSGGNVLVKSGGTFDSILNYTEGFVKTSYDDVAMSANSYQSSISVGYPSGFMSNMLRIRVLYYVRKGYKIFASCSLGKGLNVNVFENRADAIYAAYPLVGTNYNGAASQIISGNTWSSSVEETEITKNGILVISLGKSDDSAFSEAEYNQYIAALNATIKVFGTQPLQEEINEITNGVLFIGNVVQKSYTASGLSDTNADKRVSMESCTVLPKEKATLKFKFPSWLKCGVREGSKASNLEHHNFYFADGDTMTFRNDSCWFRICFTKLDPNETIDVADVRAAIANGELKIFVEGASTKIEDRNVESEKYIKALLRPFVSGQSNNSGFHNYPVFAHTSDVHGDATRFKSFADYCDFLGVDAGLVSGDMVAEYPADSMQYINDVADTHNTMLLPCVGNHDARGLTTAQDQYDNTIGYLITKYSLSTNPNENYPTYFYKDFLSKKIRLISINLYELAHTNDNANFTQTQCEWLISTLAATPQDYGVLIMFHCPDKMPEKDNGYGAFYQDIINVIPWQSKITGDPFTQIADAFIGKTTATITYTIGNNTISVPADFTGVASGVEFIAFVNGHLHVDRVGYSPSTTYKQLNLNVTCGVAIYGGSSYPYYADCSDMPRGCVGSTQDCFNIYVIDRATKTVRVAKVGSNVDSNLNERKYMVIPYAD